MKCGLPPSVNGITVHQEKWEIPAFAHLLRDKVLTHTQLNYISQFPFMLAWWRATGDTWQEFRKSSSLHFVCPLSHYCCGEKSANTVMPVSSCCLLFSSFLFIHFSCVRTQHVEPGFALHCVCSRPVESALWWCSVCPDPPKADWVDHLGLVFD